MGLVVTSASCNREPTATTTNTNVMCLHDGSMFSITCKQATCSFM